MEIDTLLEGKTGYFWRALFFSLEKLSTGSCFCAETGTLRLKCGGKYVNIHRLLSPSLRRKGLRRKRIGFLSLSSSYPGSREGSFSEGERKVETTSHNSTWWSSSVYVSLPNFLPFSSSQQRDSFRKTPVIWVWRAGTHLRFKIWLPNLILYPYDFLQTTCKQK
jgi:hypothetical protein